MLVSVIACHAVQVLRTRLKGHWIRLSWQSIRNRTENSTPITASMRARQEVQPLH